MFERSKSQKPQNLRKGLKRSERGPFRLNRSQRLRPKIFQNFGHTYGHFGLLPVFADKTGILHSTGLRPRPNLIQCVCFEWGVEWGANHYCRTTSGFNRKWVIGPETRDHSSKPREKRHMSSKFQVARPILKEISPNLRWLFIWNHIIWSNACNGEVEIKHTNLMFEVSSRLF